MCIVQAEDARVQEDTTGPHLPHIEYNATQLPFVDGHVAHLLLRVRRTAVGNRAPGRPLLRVRGQMSRKVQGSSERRLLAEWVTDVLTKHISGWLSWSQNLSDSMTCRKKNDRSVHWSIDWLTDRSTDWRIAPLALLTDRSVVYNLRKLYFSLIYPIWTKINFAPMSIRSSIQNVNISCIFRGRNLLTNGQRDRHADKETAFPVHVHDAQNVWITFCRSGWEKFKTWSWGQGEQHHHSHEGAHEEKGAGETGNLRVDQVGEISHWKVGRTGVETSRSASWALCYSSVCIGSR